MTGDRVFMAYLALSFVIAVVAGNMRAARGDDDAFFIGLLFGVCWPGLILGWPGLAIRKRRLAAAAEEQERARILQTDVESLSREVRYRP